MSARVSVVEFVQVFGETYRAIDIRTAAIQEGDTWVNSLTVLRLTYEEPKAVAARLLNLEGQHHGPIETNHFRVVMGSRPFSEWEELCNEIKQGVVRIGSIEVILRQQLALGEEKGELRPDYGEIRPIDGSRWPALQIRVGAHDVRTLSDETLTKEVAALGYSDALEPVNTLCEVNVWQGHWHGYDFYLSAPVFARVSDVRVVPAEKRLHVTLRRHHSLSNVIAIAFVREPNFRVGQPSKARVPLAASAMSREGRPIETATASVALPRVERDDWVEVRLVHPTVGEVEQFSREARMLIPPTERNILFEALKHFCSDAEFEQLLVRPHDRKVQRLDQSAGFELRVAWLLGLYGLATIVLGEYENLVAPETKVHRGSVDILAASQKDRTLFLVACTLNAPKEEGFGNLLNIRGILEQDVFADAAVRVLPVIFTAAREQPSCREIEDRFWSIPIVDADRIETLLALLRVGQEVRFFEFLGNPKLCELRKPQGV